MLGWWLGCCFFLWPHHGLDVFESKTRTPVILKLIFFCWEYFSDNYFISVCLAVSILMDFGAPKYSGESSLQWLHAIDLFGKYTAFCQWTSGRASDGIIDHLKSWRAPRMWTDAYWSPCSIEICRKGTKWIWPGNWNQFVRIAFGILLFCGEHICPERYPKIEFLAWEFWLDHWTCVSFLICSQETLQRHMDLGDAFQWAAGESAVGIMLSELRRVYGQITDKIEAMASFSDSAYTILLAPCGKTDWKLVSFCLTF